MFFMLLMVYPETIFGLTKNGKNVSYLQNANNHQKYCLICFFHFVTGLLTHQILDAIVETRNLRGRSPPCLKNYNCFHFIKTRTSNKLQTYFERPGHLVFRCFFLHFCQLFTLAVLPFLSMIITNIIYEETLIAQFQFYLLLCLEINATM